MNLTFPQKPGWHWWRASKDVAPASVCVTEDDIKKNKFAKFGGEWHPYPTFDEVMENRKNYEELVKQTTENEKRLVALLNKILGNVFVPKKEIKELLASLPKKTI